MQITPRKVNHMAMHTDRYGTNMITEWERDINGTRYWFTAYLYKDYHTIEVWQDGHGKIHHFGNL